MKTVISRRTIARIVSFSLAIIAVLGAADLVYMRRLAKAESIIEYGYRQAVEDLAQSADKISATLTKGLYAKSPAMMSKLSTKLISETGAAREALSRLPVAEVNLERTEKFLSQIGNYAYSLSAAAAGGNEPSYEDFTKITSLSKSAEEISKELWDMKSRLLSGDDPISQLFKSMDGGAGSFISESFSKLEEGLGTSPKLIYDGPFSDHILDKTPQMTKGAQSVTRDDAAKKAAPYCGVEDWQLKDCISGEEGKMPSYCFYADGVNCAVTKSGGYITYMMKHREVRNAKITPAEAEVYARAYLDSLGITNLKSTYHETYNNVCTINYAYSENNITCYTDLIKVSVALDNGDILAYDGRGYIVNHRERSMGEPRLSSQECQDKLSPALRVVDASLAVIPTESIQEKLCWEFKCKTEEDRTVLVYINSDTGAEEEILMLIETPESTLTI